METTAQGAAALAALELGWQTMEPLTQQSPETVFEPNMTEGTRSQLLSRWQKAISRAAQWEEPGSAIDP